MLMAYMVYSSIIHSYRYPKDAARTMVPPIERRYKKVNIKDSLTKYGLISQLFHWIMAITIIGMFGFGLWMTELDYYDQWYQDAPQLHKSVGVLLFGVWILRVGWRTFSQKPQHPSLAPWEKHLSLLIHNSLYILILLMIVSGYLIATGDGHSIEVFSWFDIPSFYTQKGLEDSASDLHEIFAFTLIGVATLHGIAALKHHFVNKDNVLTSMLPLNKKKTNQIGTPK